MLKHPTFNPDLTWTLSPSLDPTPCPLGVPSYLIFLLSITHLPILHLRLEYLAEWSPRESLQLASSGGPAMKQPIFEIKQCASTKTASQTTGPTANRNQDAGSPRSVFHIFQLEW